MEEKKLIDIHTHIIPNVDDGANSFEESLLMIEEMVEQGVTDVFATPHVHSNATKAPWEVQVKKFELLKEKVKHLDINLHLGAEARYRKNLRTNYEDYKFVGTNYILMEFSWFTKDDVHGVLKDLKNKGLIPIVAHVERYSYLTIDDYKKMKEDGVLLQVNTGALIGIDREKWQTAANILIDEKLADFVATDCHNTVNRLANLKETYYFLKDKIDEEYLDDLFYNNALKIIESKK